VSVIITLVMLKKDDLRVEEGQPVPAPVG